MSLGEGIALAMRLKICRLFPSLSLILYALRYQLNCVCMNACMPICVRERDCRSGSADGWAFHANFCCFLVCWAIYVTQLQLFHVLEGRLCVSERVCVFYEACMHACVCPAIVYNFF